MTFWRKFPLSVAGGIAVVKMVVPPRLLFHLTNLPFYVTPGIFQKFETVLKELKWNCSRCRVALAKLYFPSDRGGLALPNMEQYYLASQLQWVAR